MRVPIDDLEFADGYFYKGKLFTGTSVETWPDGAMRAEQDFLDGFKHGLYREWTPRGVMLIESPIVSGGVHGIQRTWYETGQLESETHYQFGIRLTETKWTPAGEVESTFRLDKTTKAFADLERERSRIASRHARRPGQVP